MADYPDSIYNPRVMKNRPGAVYDPLKTKVIFAEDFNKDRDEIVAIQTELGTNPKGTFSSVAAFLTALSDSISDLIDALAGKQDVLGFTPENVSNKKTTLSDNSDIYYPSQKCVKTEIDNLTSLIGNPFQTISFFDPDQYTFVKNGNGICYFWNSAIELYSGSTSGNYAGICSNQKYCIWNEFNTIISVDFILWNQSKTTNQEQYIGFSYNDAIPVVTDSDHVLFKIVNSRLWCVSGNEAGSEAFDTGIDVPQGVQSLKLRFEMKLDEYVKFYVNGSLVATLSEYLPSGFYWHFIMSFETTANSHSGAAFSFLNIRIKDV